jgi:hypothetical protein
MSILDKFFGVDMSHMKELILSVCEDYANGITEEDIAITNKISISMVSHILSNFYDNYNS